MKDILAEINEAPTIQTNRLPVITWRWLKVNEFQLDDFTMEKVLPYNKGCFTAVPSGNIDVKAMAENIHYLEAENYFKNKGNIGVSDTFVKMVDTFYNTGAFIHVKDKIQDPVIISYKPDESNPMIMDKNFIVAEENSEVTVIIDYTSIDNTSALHNGLTKIYAKDGATINLIKLQDLNDTSINLDSNIAYIGENAKANYVSIEVGSDKSVVSYISNLEEEASESNLDSIYLVNGSRTLDMNYIMSHIGKKTLSRINAYGALMGKAKKTFKGTLDFKKGSTLSKASEEEYTILLDKTVKSQAIPLLLCQEDDVEGLHAASAGKIDEDQLFYIMSRGFSEKEAKKLIVESYFTPIIDKIPLSSMREEIQNIMNQRLMDV
ncbi:MAG: Fe-S cluster assembly protein SufD [Clostridiaceae bacterium]|nr:Fe-S cluster assembly protein SufD [Clostridiaceae bacterium]